VVYTRPSPGSIEVPSKLPSNVVNLPSNRNGIVLAARHSGLSVGFFLPGWLQERSRPVRGFAGVLNPAFMHVRGLTILAKRYSLVPSTPHP